MSRRGTKQSRYSKNAGGVYPPTIVTISRRRVGGSTEGWYGGGDPDRTGDPRLMSPLLCQLSYTATWREVRYGGHNLTRGRISVSMERAAVCSH